MARVLCDLDGCVVGLLPAWLAKYNALGVEAPVGEAQITAYDFGQFVKYPKLLFSALCAGATREAVPETAAIAGIKALESAGHDVVFITYVIKDNRRGFEEKLDWLERYGLGHIPVIFCHSSQKQHVAGDVLIEDYPKTLCEWLGQHPTDGGTYPGKCRRGFLISQQYNKGEDGAQAERWGALRVNNILEVAGILAKENVK